MFLCKYRVIASRSYDIIIKPASIAKVLRRTVSSYSKSKIKTPESARTRQDLYTEIDVSKRKWNYSGKTRFIDILPLATITPFLGILLSHENDERNVFCDSYSFLNRLDFSKSVSDNQRFKCLDKQLGEGSFGVVQLGKDLVSNYTIVLNMDVYNLNLNRKQINTLLLRLLNRAKKRQAQVYQKVYLDFSMIIRLKMNSML